MYLTITNLTGEPELYRSDLWLRMLEPHTPASLLDDDVELVVIGDKAPERDHVLARARLADSILRNRVQLALGRHHHARDAKRAERVVLRVANHGKRALLATLEDGPAFEIAAGGAVTINGSGFVALREQGGLSDDSGLVHASQLNGVSA
jgi:hypothetical protein